MSLLSEIWAIDRSGFDGFNNCLSLCSAAEEGTCAKDGDFGSTSGRGGVNHKSNIAVFWLVGDRFSDLVSGLLVSNSQCGTIARSSHFTGIVHTGRDVLRTVSTVAISLSVGNGLVVALRGKLLQN